MSDKNVTANNQDIPKDIEQFFAQSEHFDDPPFILLRDVEIGGVLVRNVPYETYVFQSVSDSFMPYSVEKVLLNFSKQNNRCKQIDYSAVEELAS